MKRNIYLNMLECNEALEKIKASIKRESLVKTIVIKSANALNYVLAKEVYAKFSSPISNTAAMDGYAVKASDTYTAREGKPVEIELNDSCYAVNTGNLLNKYVDAVVMIENVQEKNNKIILEAPLYPYQNVRKAGEDIVAKELLFPKYHKLSATDIAALLTGGIYEVEVFEELKVIVIPTGDEILDFNLELTPKDNQVVESNSQMLSLLISQLHCQAKRIPPIKDKEQDLAFALENSLKDNHIVIFCAGSSAGTKDFTKSIFAKYGEILVHGIKVMPGKPSIVANCGNKLVVGSPGYPVSALVCFEKIIAPLIKWLNYEAEIIDETILVKMAKKCPSKLGLEEIIRLNIAKVDDKYMAIPLNKGAGNISTVARSQGWTSVPVNSEGINEGQFVEAKLSVPKYQLENSLMCVGSHDNLLDIIRNELIEKNVYLSSSHVGSTGGITALKNNACHFAGMHLLDEKTKDYNFPFLAEMLPNMDLVVINLALREQGLILAKNNPLNIQNIEDIVAKQARFLNRQLGSGTRILFDQILVQKNIDSKAILGYDKQEYTHNAAAFNVFSGLCDVTMGIKAAANALDLDFIPITTERYDLVIPQKFMKNNSILAMLEVIKSKKFKDIVYTLGGYDLSLSAQVMQAKNV